MLHTHIVEKMEANICVQYLVFRNPAVYGKRRRIL